MKIISISGIDGSGKSTQVERLKDDLEKNGKTVQYFHVLDFSIANTTLRRRPKDKKSKSVTSAGFFKIFLRKIGLLIDLTRFKKYYDRLEKAGNDYVITDRYFYDQIVNILYLEGERNIKGLLGSAEKKIVPPDYYIFIDVSPDAVLNREKSIDQSPDYLHDKRKLYRIFCKRWKMTVIDGEQSRDEVFEELQSVINN